MSDVANNTEQNYVTHSISVENYGADLPAEFDCFITGATVNDCPIYELTFTYDFTERLTDDNLLALKHGHNFMLWLTEHEEDTAYHYEAHIDNYID